MSYKELRDKAFNGTPRGLSFELLAANPHLVYHNPVNNLGKSSHYTIYNENSAICCTAQEALLLYKITKYINPDLVVEIGSYAGWSSTHILEAKNKDCYFIAVDNFSECNNPELVKNVLATQLGHYENTVIYEQDSTEFLRNLQVLVDLVFIVFIDGFHRDGKPLEDCKAAINKVTVDGLLILHDTWMPDVIEAHNYIIAQGFKYHTFQTDNYLTVYSRQELDWCKNLMEELV